MSRTLFMHSAQPKGTSVIIPVGERPQALDELYHDYAKELRRLNAELEHLLRDEDLTESEQIDKRLIEAWMILAHKYRLTDPGELIAGR